MARPNVLLIVLDTVRASDVLEATQRPTTPFLSKFAEQDNTTVFTEARSPALWTLPSHTSMLTGEVVNQHGVTTLGNTFDGRTVFDSLNQSGYETGVFTENPFLVSQSYGLNSSFNHTSPYLNVLFPDALTPQAYDMQEGATPYVGYLRDSVLSGKPIRSIINGGYPLLISSTTTGQRMVDERDDAGTHSDRFLEWTASQSSPWAACLNFVDAHAPYRPTTTHNQFAPDTYRRDTYADPAQDASDRTLDIAHDLYCGGIRQCDAAVHRIINTLERREELDNTLIVVTSDHGEAFGEPVEHDPSRRLVAHRGGLNEEQLHVPLIVRHPTVSEGRVSGLASPLGFASAVRALQNDEDICSAFQFDQLLVSHEYEGSLTTDGSGRFIHALYTDEGGRIQKHVDDDGVLAEFNVEDEVRAVDVENNVSDVVTSTQSMQRTETDTDVPTDRLRDLGYLDE